MEKDILGDILKDAASGFDMDIDANEDPKETVSNTKTADIKDELPQEILRSKPQPSVTAQEPKFAQRKKHIPRTEEPKLDGVNLENLSKVAAQTVKAGKSWLEEILDFAFNTAMNLILFLVNTVLALVGAPQLSYFGNGSSNENQFCKKLDNQ